MSRDGHSALLLVELGRGRRARRRARRAANGAAGFEALIVGEESIDEDFSRAADEDLARGELFGLALALLVLIVVFRGLCGAFVPIAVAVASIVVALAIVAGIGQAFVLNFVVVNVLVMMGLAVGIDYSLFVVSRFREERAAGRAPRRRDRGRRLDRQPRRAVLRRDGRARAARDVPRAAHGVPLDRGRRDRRRARRGARRADAAAGGARDPRRPDRAAARARPPRARGGGIWSRVAAIALRRPAASLAAGVGILVALAVPFTSIETGTAGVGTLPESFQTRAAYTAIEDAFGPQGTSVAEVVVKGERTPELRRPSAELRRSLAGDPAYGETSVDVAPAVTVTRVTVPVDADAAGPAASAAVKALRERYVPRRVRRRPRRDAGRRADRRRAGLRGDRERQARRSCSRSCSG